MTVMGHCAPGGSAILARMTNEVTKAYLCYPYRMLQALSSMVQFSSMLLVHSVDLPLLPYWLNRNGIAAISSFIMASHLLKKTSPLFLFWSCVNAQITLPTVTGCVGNPAGTATFSTDLSISTGSERIVAGDF